MAKEQQRAQLKIPKLGKAAKTWLNKTAKKKYDTAYEYLTPKQKRMIMQDMPRKLREMDKKNPYWGTGIKGGAGWRETFGVKKA